MENERRQSLNRTNELSIDNPIYGNTLSLPSNINNNKFELKDNNES